ncbi:MAG: hypothetical protein P1V34_04395, partial [Alphaproteobacteria bacterium]|nr:hypothetical protein [Alphaproteobacteria bacterium]
MMKITSFLEPSRDEASSTSLFGEAGIALLGHSRRIKRSKPPGKTRLTLGHIPDPPPLGPEPFGDDYDRVTPSLEATYLMIGERYDPRSLALHDMIDMTDMLV